CPSQQPNILDLESGSDVRLGLDPGLGPNRSVKRLWRTYLGNSLDQGTLSSWKNMIHRGRKRLNCVLHTRLTTNNCDSGQVEASQLVQPGARITLLGHG